MHNNFANFQLMEMYKIWNIVLFLHKNDLAKAATGWTHINLMWRRSLVRVFAAYTQEVWKLVKSQAKIKTFSPSR